MGDKDNQPTFTEIMNDPDYHRAMGLFESMCREMTEEGSKYKLHQIKFALLNAAGRGACRRKPQGQGMV
jgi:hypothetical protein